MRFDGKLIRSPRTGADVQRQGSEAGAPYTTVGLWLRALLRGDSEDYRRLVHKLNRGAKGWNDDEPAVVEAACQLAVREFFESRPSVTIEAFVADMCKRISKERTPPRQEDMEAVIRSAQGNTRVPGDIRRSELLSIRMAVTGNITDILRFDAEQIDLLVSQAESVAVERGYHPPFANES
jgi:hypothetical protein